MSYRFSQLSPQISTHGTNLRIIRGRWSASPESFREAQSGQPWLEYAYEELTDGSRRLNWNAVFGLAFTVVLSCAFWTGLGLIAAHFWK
jgi:hypothetical protein